MGDVRLRPYDERDIPDLLATWADPLTMMWSVGPSDEAGAREWFERRNDWTPGDHASWAVADDADRLIGSVSLHHIDLDLRESQIGYTVSPWARGSGVATAAVRLAVNYAFIDLKIRRVTAFHAIGNEGSCAVARSVGFRLEGVTKQSFRYADGEYHDEHLHALLVDEWDVSH